MDRAVNQAQEQRPFPDVILRSQFFALIGSRTLSSEQRLMLAVLADAINIVQDYGRSLSMRRHRSFTEARNWIFARVATCPLSFDNVCDALGMDADGLRRRLSNIASELGGEPLRLRLKEATRNHRMSVNRPRRRHRRNARHLNPSA